MYIIGITGMRPSKLKGGYNWNSKENIKLLSSLNMQIEKIILKHKDEDEIVLVSGGCIGTDQMAFFIGENLRKTYKNLKLEIAIPFKHQYGKWTMNDIRTYRHQLRCADYKTYTDSLPEYTTKRNKYHKYQIRNMYIVDKSDIIVAVWSGVAGGTKNTYNYAIEKNVPVTVINPNLL